MSIEEATPDAGASQNPREAIARKIAEKRQADTRETHIANDVVDEIVDEELDEEAAGLEAEESPQDKPAKTDPIYVREGRRFVKVKVDGEDKEVDFDQFHASYQKSLAADKRLEEAARARQEAERRARELAAREHEFISAYEQWENERNPPVNTDDALNQALNALVEGDVNSAKTALSQVLNRPQIDPNQILHATRQQVASEFQQRDAVQFRNEVAEADHWFAENHKELETDPGLKNITQGYIRQIGQENPGIRPRQLLERAAELTRNWMAERGIGAAATEDRRDRKRQATSRALSSDATSRLPSPAVKPKSTRDVVAQMKARRGQRV